MTTSQPDTRMRPLPRLLFILYFAVLLPLLGWALYVLVRTNLTTGPASQPVPPGQLLLMVMVAGAIGSYIHAATSFVSYAGNRQLTESWTAWYALRPFIGIAMALVFYFAARGGVLLLTTDSTAIDPYGMMAMAALAGMFSKQASDKLADVFDTLFRSRVDEVRQDKLENPVPRLTALQPSSAPLDAGETTVRLIGAGFVASTRARVDGQERATRFRDADTLELTLTRADLAVPGVRSVTAFTPAPGGGTSDSLPFTVGAAGTAASSPDADTGFTPPADPEEKRRVVWMGDMPFAPEADPDAAMETEEEKG